MIKIFALLILWSLPWRPQFLGQVAEIQIVIGCEARPDLDGVCAAYYEDNDQPRTIRLCENKCLWSALGDFVLHESQHHMQLRYHMWRWPGGYTVFEEAVLYEMDHGDYTDEVRSSVQALVQADKASDRFLYSELHAQLPVLLDMQIPAPLRYWYPWFFSSRVGAS